MTTQEKIGAMLREARENKKLSMAQVERATGVTAVNVCYIENGKRGFNIGTLVKLCEAYDVDIEFTPAKTR